MGLTGGAAPGGTILAKFALDGAAKLVSSASRDQHGAERWRRAPRPRATFSDFGRSGPGGVGFRARCTHGWLGKTARNLRSDRSETSVMAQPGSPV